MTEHEFDDWMRSLDPARASSIPEPDSTRGQAIRDAALGTRRSRRGLIAAIAAAIVLVTGATVGAVAWLTDEPSRTDVICFAGASLDADRIQGDPELGLGIDACLPLWQDGILGAGLEVPPLAACVLDGAVGVFPGGDETCASLDLLVAAGGEAALTTLRQLDRDVRAAVVGDGRCVPPIDAVHSVEEILDDLGLTEVGWIVLQTTPASEDRPCASFGIDEPARTVVIVPIPRS